MERQETSKMTQKTNFEAVGHSRLQAKRLSNELIEICSDLKKNKIPLEQRESPRQAYLRNYQQFCLEDGPSMSPKASKMNLNPKPQSRNDKFRSSEKRRTFNLAKKNTNLTSFSLEKNFMQPTLKNKESPLKL